MFGFIRKRKNSFPSDAGGRRDAILSVHRYVSHNDDVRDAPTIDLLLDLISGESDPYLMSAYVIYYLGSYKPFHDGNEDTAKRVSDMILADCGLVIPRTPSTNYFYNGACGKAYAIEEIVDWEKAHAERIVR